VLYRHFDADGRLLYIGISLEPIIRLRRHRQSSWAADIRRIEVMTYPDRASAELAETNAIQSELPVHNVLKRRVPKIAHPKRISEPLKSLREPNPDQMRMIGEVDRYCERLGISVTTFGMKAGQSGRFYKRLVAGRRSFSETLASVRQYMRDNPPPPRKRKRNRTEPRTAP
jgi:hypothetical protein